MRGLRWWIVGLLTLATMVNYLDRSCLGVAAPTLKKEIGLNEVTFAYIVTGFQITYMIMQPIAGRIIDLLGSRRGFLLAVIWWSVANMLHGFSGGWRSFAFFRGLLGMGEAGNFPAAIKTISEWFPPKERTVATGIFNMGAGVGAMIAPPLVVFLILRFNWQAAFIVTGAVGFIWVLLWSFMYQSPLQHRWITPAEKKNIEQAHALELTAETAESQSKGVWRLVLTQRNFWGLAIARFLSEPAWQFFIYWIPLYLATERGLNLKQIGFFAWVPFLAGDLGSLFGGFLSPFFLRGGLSVINARRAAVTVCALIMVFAIFIGQAPTAGWAIFFFCLGSFAHQGLSATLLSLPADLFPSRSVATANGMSGGIGSLGGMIFTLVIGYVAMRMGYKPLFVTIAFLDIIGAIVLWLLLRPPVADLPASAERQLVEEHAEVS